MQNKCPVCDAAPVFAFTTKDWNRKISGKSFEYRRCPECGYLFLFNIPTDLDLYYGNDYYNAPKIEKLKKVAKKESYQLGMVREFMQGGRLLEVGAGFGVFAYQAKQAGFDVNVIERGGRCCEFLRNYVGVRVIEGDAPQESIEHEKGYDVIALWQVIEHLPYPWEFLAKAAKNLNENGILVISTPNPLAFQFKFQKSKWPHIDAPRHLCLIPFDCLEKYLRPLGLNPVKISFTDKGGKSWNRFGWQRYLMNLFSSKWLQRGAYVLGYTISIPLAIFDCHQRSASTYTAIFKKTKSRSKEV